MHHSKVAFHLPGLSGPTNQFLNGTHEFSQLVLPRMALLVDQRHSILPFTSAKARKFEELWRENCTRRPWTFPFNLAKRTWGDREGHWGCWPGYVDATEVIFSFRKSVFRDVHTDYNLDLNFLVKKQISMTDLSWGHLNIFRGDTRSLCFSWVYKRSLFAGYAKN